MAALRIGTRRSDLARWQAERVRALLAARGVTAELVPIVTAGDEDAKPSPGAVSGPLKGAFTKEIEAALLDGRVDLAVHSLKDLLIAPPEGLVLAAFPERADPRDALLARTGAGLSELPAGARVGTSSTRRRAALRSARPDLQVVPLRGNVPTRVRRVDEGAVHAALLALAGLARLGLAARARAVDPGAILPAPGQGALAVQARTDDRRTLERLAPLDDPAVRAAVEAERAALAGLDTGCDVPIGALCRVTDDALILDVAVYALDGRPPLAARIAVDARDPAAGGRQAAARLLGAGAAERIAEARRAALEVR